MTNINAQHPDYLFMIEQAVKAPSGHNTQPWLFSVKDDAIQIRPDYDKSLPVVDPDNRELFISLGCAAENVCVTAPQKGYDTDLTISEDGIITIHLKKNQTVEPNPLFAQIAIRQTNRSIYNEQTISSDTIRLLERLFETSPAKAYFYKNGTPEFNAIADFVIAGNVLQMQNKAFTDELKSWMRFNKKHQDSTNDGLSYAAFGAPNLPRFIIKPIMSGYLNDKTQNKGDRKKIASSSHFMLLTTTDNTPEGWIQLGIIMERFLLKITELEIAHAYMNQPNEVKELAGKMTETLNIPDEYPVILLRIGYGEKMPYSKRKDIKEVIVF
ncbi:nitroreductase family protein [Bacteroides sp. OttesenSCG-928-D19]|nr:nitroreductase family protein [Bacteroides sp. OttesenSCG-928-D19]